MGALPVRVLKFGSSVLPSPAALPHAVHEVYRALREGRRVVAVVSAFGATTDRLLARARRVAREPEPAALAAYVATGETRAAALLALALERAGVPAVVVDPARAGLVVRGGPLDGELIAVDAAAIERVLDSGAVAVVPGFQGRDADDGVALLARGGSDLSALFLADALGGSCRLLKDVDGVYDRDTAEPGARRYEHVSWKRALAIGGGIVQAQSLRFARERRLAFEVAAPGSDAPTVVGAGPSTFACERKAVRPLRVALLGLGTVGLGVWRVLAREPRRFDVRAILVRDLARPRAADVRRELLTDDPHRALERPLDLAIECVGGVEEPGRWIEALLERGVDVVSANKELLARRGPFLEALAAERGARLRGSATVGGAVPMLEVAARLAAGEGVEALEGVLNGTCNFVLDRLARGQRFDAALRAARTRGLAEADASRDLGGVDAGEKLELLARAAFGPELARRIRWRERCGIAHLEPEAVLAAARAGRSVRLVGSLARSGDGLEARLAPRELAPEHALAGVRGAGNALVLATRRGARVVLRGTGAGRRPTSAAVLGDALELERDRVPARIPVLAERGGAA